MTPPRIADPSRVERGAPAGFVRVVRVAAALSFAVAVLAVAVDVVGGRAGGSTSSASRALAALALALACVALVAVTWQRRGRSVAGRRTGFALIAVGFGATFGLQAVLYLITVDHAGPVEAWIEDIPLLAGIGFMAAGALLVSWPPGMTRRDVARALGDTAVAAVGVLSVWVMLVLPNEQPAGSAVEAFFIRLDVWVLYAGVVAVTLVAATSRRTGALPVRQLIGTQVAVLIYILSEVLSDSIPTSDRQNSISYSVVGFCLSTVLMVWVVLRPDLEPETAASMRARDEWAVLAPLGLAAISTVVAAAYVIAAGTVARGAVLILSALLVLMMGVLVLGRLAVDRDSRRLGRAEVSLSLESAAQAPWFAALLAESRDLVLVVDRRGRVVFQSPSVTTTLGFTTCGLVGRDFARLLDHGDHEAVDKIFQRAAHSARDRGPHEMLLLDAQGLRRETEVVVTPLRWGQADGFVVTARDVTDRRRLRAELAAAGSRDRLTGLSNREAFVGRLRSMAALAEPRTLAVATFDLVGFGDVNDGLGHEAGDRVLKAVAWALDALPGTVAVAARFSGDEFAVIVADPSIDADSSIDAEVARTDRELRSGLAAVALPDGRRVPVDFQLGYAVLTNASTTAADLLERADLALREARSTGRERVRYSADLRAGLVSRLRAEADLREALDGGAVVVHYQPVVRLSDGQLVGVEALVRLRAPDGSLVPPVEFIARAEQLGLVEQVGDIVLDRALGDIGALAAAFGSDTVVAVNVSPSQGPDLVGRVSTLLVRHGVAARRLIVEFTEESLAENHAEAAAVLAGLRAIGVRVALDDFGTGYSSLAYLAGLPVDKLKIDRSFVSQMNTSATSLTLVRTVVQLARALDLITVAEGVETVEQADLLRGMGCELAQGYLYARPMPLDQLLALSREGAPWLVPAALSAPSDEGDVGTPSEESGSTAAGASVVTADVHSRDHR